MIEAYTVNSTGGQAAPKSLVIIVCFPPRDGQLDGASLEDVAPYVIQAAQQYLTDCGQNTGVDAVSLGKLQEDEIECKAIEADAIICAFDLPAEALLKWAKSTNTRVPGTDGSNRILAGHPSLKAALESEVWTSLANISNENINAGSKIELFSGGTYVPLSQFKSAVQFLVDDSTLPNLRGVVDLKNTGFWRRMVKSEANSASTKPNYTHGSALQNTFRRSRLSCSRLCPTPDSSLLIPRTMPVVALEGTNRYTGTTGHSLTRMFDSNE